MESNWSRKSVLAALTAATGGLAGCADDASDDDQSDPGADETDDSEPTTETAEQTTDIDALVDQLAAYSTPLETVDPDDSLDDLEFLADILSNKQLIGMGESTHGTREFFQFRHRLLRFLVEEHGLRVVAWEDDFSNTVALDRYIRTGEGDPRAILARGYRPWQTTSVLEMIEWMRTFNMDRPSADKLRFYGFDTWNAGQPMAELERFFERADDDFLDQHEDAVEAIQNIEAVPPIPDGLIEEYREFPATVRTHLDENSAQYRETVGAEEVALPKQHTRIIDQRIEHADKTFETDLGAPLPWNHRDRSMAENVSWILDHEDGAQVALWGHSTHLTTEQFVSDIKPAGIHLDDWYGDQYYTIGQEFGDGTFRFEWSGRSNGGVVTVDSPPVETVPGILSRLKDEYTFVDISTAVETDSAGDWLTDEQKLTFHGWGFTQGRFWHDVAVSESFDALVFVRNSSGTNEIEGLQY